jgi:hypothetical protein
MNKKSSKKNFKHSDFETNDSQNLRKKSVKKDKGTKRKLSIYDEFDEESMDSDFNIYDDYMDE